MIGALYGDMHEEAQGAKRLLSLEKACREPMSASWRQQIQFKNGDLVGFFQSLIPWFAYLSSEGD